jgi:membrane-associated phospholipid phosphatase
MPRLGATMLIAVLLSPSLARAQTPPVQQKSSTSQLAEWGAPLAALGGSLWLAIALNASECRWCDRDDAGRDTLNGFDRTIRHTLLWSPSARHAAAHASDAMAGSMIALPYALLWPRTHHADAVKTMAWVFAVDAAATGVPKRLIARERPYVHFDDTSAASDSHADASFPSNHTSRSFASVFAAARLCEMTDCPHEDRIWWIGLPLASVTGLLRIGADKHYATDVLTGAAAGAVIGWYVPVLARSVKIGPSSQISIEPLLGRSAGISLSWAWQ